MTKPQARVASCNNTHRTEVWLICSLPQLCESMSTDTSEWKHFKGFCRRHVNDWCECSETSVVKPHLHFQITSRHLAAVAYRLAEDHVSPLLHVETLRQATGCLLQEDKGHGSFRLLHHLRHTILQLGHQRMQLLPPVPCGERRGGRTSGRRATRAAVKSEAAHLSAHPAI